MKKTRRRKKSRTHHPVKSVARRGLAAALLFSGLVLAPSGPARAEEPLWGEAASTLGKGFLNVNTTGRARSSRPYNHHGGPVLLTIDRMDAGFSFEYGLTSDLDLYLRQPYVMETIEEEFNGQTNTHHMNGIGETEVGAKWRFKQFIHDGYKDELALIADLKLPTGNSNMKDSNGAVIDPHLQPNSGNLGARLGLAVDRHGALTRHWVSVTAAMETGSSQYKRGSMIEVHASSGRRVRRLTRPKQTDWMGVLGLHYHLMGKETEFGRTLQDSGGSVLSAELSLLTSMGARGLRVGVLVPIVTNVGSSHAPPKHEIIASYRASF